MENISLAQVKKKVKKVKKKSEAQVKSYHQVLIEEIEETVLVPGGVGHQVCSLQQEILIDVWKKPKCGLHSRQFKGSM